MPRLFFFFAPLIFISGYTLYAQEVYHRTTGLMGSRFDITVVATSQTKADEYIDLAIEEISRIEKLISSWDPSSITSDINNAAGLQPIAVNQEYFDFIQRCIGISRLTDGAFDITYASMDRIWKFDGSMTSMPPQNEIRASVNKVGYEKIILNPVNNTIFLSEKGMKIGFGGIGKGYAADKAKALLIKHGVEAGIINASGDMNTWGKQPDGKNWLVAITNPLNKNATYGMLPLKNGAVVTSGNYEKYVTFNGIRYSHIINPKTGYPATGIISATIFAPSAELADALATAIFVLGHEVGIDRINQINGAEAILITDSGTIVKSSNLNIETK